MRLSHCATIPYRLGLLLFLSLQLLYSEDLEIENVRISGNWLEIDNPDALEIWCMALDSQNGVWIGHNDGLAFYDGLDWSVYVHPEWVNPGPVIAICVTESGALYVMNKSGLCHFDDGKWTLVCEVTTTEFVSTYAVILESKSGEIWAGHDSGMIRLFKNGTIENIHTDNLVVALCEDQAGDIWWATGIDGNVYRSPVTAGVEFSSKESWNLMLEPAGEIVRTATLLSGSDGRVWLGDSRHNHNLKYYDLEKEEWVEIDLIENSGTNQVYDLTEDIRGRIWISAEGALKVIHEDEISVFKFPEVPMALVRSFMRVSEDGQLWIAEKSGRLFRVVKNGSVWSKFEGLHYQCEVLGRKWFINEDNQIVYRWLDLEGSRYEVMSNSGIIDHPIAIYSTHNGLVWAIGSDRKIAAISIYNGERWIKKRYPEFATGFDYGAFYECSDGSILIGSGQPFDGQPRLKGGVLKIRYSDLQVGFRAEMMDSDLIPYRIHGVLQLPDGKDLYAGIRLIENSGDEFRSMQDDLGYPTGWIAGLSVNGSGTVWGSTFGRGVFKYENGEFEWFKPSIGGFEDLSIITVAAHNNSEAIALTSDALYRYKSGQWRSSVELPFEYPVPRRSAGLKTEGEDTIWINLTHPYWHMKELQTNRYHSAMQPMFGTYRYRFDNEAPRTFVTNVPERQEGLRSFSVNFDGRDYWSRTQRKDLQFSYRLDGGNWSTFSRYREMDFQQLNEGKHTLEVRARDMDFNIDPVGASIGFIIDIPFWQESWFLPIIVFFVFALVILVVTSLMLRARHLVELEHQKLNFFTQLSHEIRTPLALVMAPLEQAAKKDASEVIKEYLNQAIKSSKELKRIIDQLLDFRRAQSGIMQLNLERVDIVRFCSDIAKSFKIEAAKKEQTVRFESRVSSFACRVDPEKLRGIFNNLILNALHYSPAGTEIRFLITECSSKSTTLQFVIEDNGIGMDADFLKVAFKPFSRARDTQIRSVKGSGIGLAYVNELVEILGGRINILSPVDESDKEYPGTRITVVIPVEVVNPEMEQTSETTGTSLDTQDGKSNPMLLIVEDDHEMQRFIAEELSNRFKTMCSENGKDGLTCAFNEVPDIILCDRMMPVMDGLEFCRRIRENLTTSHIPVIMLTAASSHEREMEGLKAGVNEYIGKPFSIEALAARIENQLKIRDGLRDKLRSEYEKDKVIAGELSFEDPFLNRVSEIIEKRLDDYMFDSELLGQELHISRTSLYRKLGAVAGISPSAMIKSRRMTRAASLLVETEDPINTVMENVGIIDKRSFNKWFKEHFKCTPTEYRNKMWGRS